MHFFLHGGGSSRASEKNKEFFQKLCSYGDKILIFPFGEEKYLEQFEEYKQRFMENIPDKTIYLECASTNIAQLIEQIRDNEILFFCGGKPYKHFEVINQIKNFRELIQDKIIAGTSGGAIMWSTTYYSPNAENFREGNGFLPIKIIAHRGADKPGVSWEEREKILDANGEKLPIYKIPEQEYIEMEV